MRIDSQCNLSAVFTESPWSLLSQRIRNVLQLCGDSTETALRIRCSEVAVKVAKVGELHYYTAPYQDLAKEGLEPKANIFPCQSMFSTQHSVVKKRFFGRYFFDFFFICIVVFR